MKKVLGGVMKNVALVVAMLLFPVAASAQEGTPSRSAGPAFTMLSPKLLPEGKSALHVQIGWPGIAATFRTGVSSRFDAGGRFSFNYGYENIALTVPGFKLQGVARLQLADSGRFNLGLGFEPGVYFYFLPNFTTIGITMPVKLAMGIPVGNSLMLNLGMDIPFLVTFLPFTAVAMQMLFGGGLEYALDQNMLLTFNTRFGPNITFGVNQAQFAFELQMGVAFRL